MLGIAFLITYFLSMEAMVVSFGPGIIGLVGSVIGLTAYSWNLSKKK